MSPTARPNFTFDPAQCPLLQGLSPEEQKLRMETHPVICACIGSVQTDGELLAPCGPARPKRPRPPAPDCPTKDA